MFLTDNNNGNYKIPEESRHVIEKLKKIANKTIKQLQAEYPDLLIFPYSFNVYNEENKIFSLYDDGTIITYNLMGFIGVDDISITIASRFDKDNEKQYFLQYILLKVFAINLINLPAEIDTENIWKFILFLIFPYYLNKAMRQGVYKEYIQQRYNNPNVKGHIDIPRHIKINTFFMGNIAYSTREFSYNNRITQLIQHTIEFISAQKFSKVFNNDSETLRNIRLIKNIVNYYDKSNLYKIIVNNYKSVSHPYYIEYENLRKICLKILQRKGKSYERGKDKVHGILFDGAWLWEEYLNTILKKEGFVHPENRKGKNKVYLFTQKRYERYPDFYKIDKSVVIDAKYKHLKASDINREDMHQIITYMHILKAQKGYLLFPSNQHKEVKIGDLNGYGGEVFIYGFKISDNRNNFQEFSKEMKNSEEKLIKNLKGRLA